MEWRTMRRFKQQISDEECAQVLKEAWRGVLAINGENGYPYGIPIDFYYDEEDGKIYFHGAKQGNKIDLLHENNKACLTVMDEGFHREGDWALNIRSVIAFGTIETVTDEKIAMKELTRLAKKYYPTEEGALAEVEKDGARTNMLVMSMDHMTGKLVNES